MDVDLHASVGIPMRRRDGHAANCAGVVPVRHGLGDGEGNRTAHPGAPNETHHGARSLP